MPGSDPPKCTPCGGTGDRWDEARQQFDHEQGNCPGCSGTGRGPAEASVGNAAYRNGELGKQISQTFDQAVARRTRWRTERS